MMNADEVIKIEQLLYYYEQGYTTGQHQEMPYLFTCSEEPRLSVGSTMRGNVVHRPTGMEEVKNTYTIFEAGTPQYDTFHAGQQVCAPTIIIGPGGVRASGFFPTHGFFINCCGTCEDGSLPQPPYTVSATFEMWFHDFMKEDNLWKIQNFGFNGFIFTHNIWGWNPPETGGLAAECQLKSAKRPEFDLNAYKESWKKYDEM